MDTDKEQLIDVIQQQIDATERQMAAMLGQQLYKKEEGFSQEEIYTFCGKDDAVVTMTLRPDTNSSTQYGTCLTGQIVYTIKERALLNANTSALDTKTDVKVNILIDSNGNIPSPKLLCEIPTHDIISLLVAPSTADENKFYSEEKRKPNVLEIPFEGLGNGDDIGWMYGELVRFMEQGIAITPDEYTQYLAYKLVLDTENLSPVERSLIFNDDGQINNNEVARIFLEWKKQANCLKGDDRKTLLKLNIIRMQERLAKLEELLKGIGGLKRFSEKHLQKAMLIIDKTLRFHQHRYNVVGKHLLYLDLDGFLHIYLRHVEELTIAGYYSERTKFQLNEKDVEITIKHVMTALNEEYQEFRDKYPDKQFRKYEDDAYYCNGDYYALRVEPDGRLIQFYKIGKGR